MDEINLNAHTHEWTRQMCYIYLRVRIIIVGKMKACKRMELAKIILKKVTNSGPERQSPYVLSHMPI